MATIAAHALGTAKCWAPGGMDSKTPRGVIAGSCKKATREQRDQSCKRLPKEAEASLHLLRLICLNRTCLGS